MVLGQRSGPLVAYNLSQRSTMNSAPGSYGGLQPLLCIGLAP